jgi:hypothetical protein
MPNRTPAGQQGPGANRLFAAAVIAFSLTLVGAGIAMLLGLVPRRMLPGLDGVDAAVLLLFVPLCALTLAILAEAVRASFTGSFRPTVLPKASLLEPWRPGHGEG